MPWAAAAAVAGAVISSNAADNAAEEQANAARNASDTSYRAAQEANALQERVYNQNRADNEEWRKTGVNALGQLANYKSPINEFGATPEFTNPNISNAKSDFANPNIANAKVDYANPNIAQTPFAQPNVDAWYTNALGKTADAEGKAYWESQMASGQSPENVYRDFVATAQANGATVNPAAQTWQAASAPTQQFRNPDLTTQFQSTDFRDAASAYGNPNLKNLLADFSTKDFQEDPGYQYRLDQGNRSVENSSAARGSQLSGATLKALARFGQNEASQEFGNSFNRFMTQRNAQYGQSANDYSRADAQRQNQYDQRATQYGLGEQQRQARLGLDTANYNRADAQRSEQYGQANDQFNRNEGQRRDQYGQASDQFKRNEGQRQDMYGQATDLYNRSENQRINKYGMQKDQYGRNLDADTLQYNRLASQAGLGQVANKANAEGAQNYAYQVGANTANAAKLSGIYGTAAGDAQASNSLAQGNIVNRGINSLYSKYKENQNQDSGDYIGGLNSFGRNFANNYSDQNYG